MLAPELNERTLRLFAAAEARCLGRGGISLVARAIEVSRDRISRGMHDLEAQKKLEPDRIRRPGGGRKREVKGNPGIKKDLEQLISPYTRGDPESPLRWTCKSVRKLAAELKHKGHQVSHSSVAALLRELDDAVLPKQPEDYIKFIAARETITSAAKKAESGMIAVLDKLAGYGKQNPIAIVYDLLTQCPDDAIPKSTADLSFITDDAYRDMLRKELVSIENFLNARQWKAAMVIGGSLIEALLWFVLDSRRQDAVSSLQKLKQQGEIHGNMPNDLNRWYLKEYVKVAYDMGLLQDRTRALSLLVGEYRNLIHAGKAVREKAECTRGAAHGVFWSSFRNYTRFNTIKS